MLICYAYHATGPGQVQASLSIVADRPDSISVPVPVESLVITDSALIRIGPQEALKVAQDPNGIILTPLPPGRLYLTPDLLDKPGIFVRYLRISRDQRGNYLVFFRQEKDGPDDWRPWKPNEVV